MPERIGWRDLFAKAKAKRYRGRQVTMRHIAKESGVSVDTIRTWLEGNPRTVQPSYKNASLVWNVLAKYLDAAEMRKCCDYPLVIKRGD